MARQRRGSLSYHRLGSLSYHRFYSMTGICASFYLLRRTLRTGADFSAFGAFYFSSFLWSGLLGGAFVFPGTSLWLLSSRLCCLPLLESYPVDTRVISQSPSVDLRYELARSLRNPVSGNTPAMADSSSFGS